ncbi:O antigen biosynthesis rhamnosyltransferase RfbN [Mucilaginibacter gynuensis]|uniref:O antigen biosynthesis rhamnosyltransferase RfbN n=1 Tax=Mucilaginibacter gynuensis TaxID=1302236 RepID=A0ABP8GNF3_9SPHI
MNKPGTSHLKVALFIPTYNAGSDLEKLLASVESQSEKPDLLAIIDSDSTDDTVATAERHDVKVTSIEKKDFTHGYARHKLIDLYPGYDIYIYLTQDAILASSDSLKNVIAVFSDQKIGVAYGRQLPKSNATLLERHNRDFNYPDKSYIRSKTDINEYGFKTIFCSNSFAAYRYTAYKEVGGFPVEAKFGEDTLITAKMISKGWKIAYVAEAPVYHSHNYSNKQEYERYIEIGKFHRQNPQLYREFGKPAKEGVRFILSQFTYLIKRNPLRLFEMAAKTISKWRGYKKGYKGN